MSATETTAGANLAAARLLVAELLACGVRDAVASPGARSTPLVMALAENESVKLRMVTDERAGAYFALGLSESSRKPVVLLSTSGSAAANFLPAVAEASLAGVALIVITADRPAELRDCGAAQTIDQVGMFDAYAKWSVDLIAPAAAQGLDSYYRRVACRAVAAALEAPLGPVHINAPVREPLVESNAAAYSGPTADNAGPQVIVYPPSGLLADAAATELSALLGGCQRGLIVCGPRSLGGYASDAPAAAAAIAGLADTLAWPLLADPLSGLRYPGREGIVDSYDVLLRSETFVAEHQPDLILRFGGLPSSKALQQFIAAAAPAAEHVLVADAGTWPDPFYAASRVVRAAPAALAAALTERMSACGGGVWRASWLEASRTVRASLDQALGELSETFSGRVAAELLSALPDDAQLFVGNSMAVRDLDTFVGAGSSAVTVSANRGANGIDGVLSTALGVAAGHGGPVALLIGDLSFLHDIGGLQIAARHQLDLLVVVVNNDGGAIFSFLPQADHVPEFERLFVTPHGLDLGPAVSMCGGAFTRAESWSELQAVLQRWRADGGLYVVEVPCDRERDRGLHRALVELALSSVPGRGQGAT